MDLIFSSVVFITFMAEEANPRHLEVLLYPFEQLKTNLNCFYI